MVFLIGFITPSERSRILTKSLRPNNLSHALPSSSAYTSVGPIFMDSPRGSRVPNIRLAVVSVRTIE